MDLPKDSLEQFGWESFKALLAHFCGKKRVRGMLWSCPDAAVFPNSFNFAAAAAAAARIHNYVPIGSREEMKLRALFMKVSNIQLGSLCIGIDEGEEPDLGLSREDGIEEEEDDVGAWMMTSRKLRYDGMDCFGVSM
eukprot:1156527-Pelagomonas_calceolata.AAC.1